MTIDGLAARVGYGSITLDHRSVVFMDEASMVDTHRLAALARIAEESGCQLRLIGDTEQLQAIGAGGLFEKLVEQVPGAGLEQIHRAREEWMRTAQLAVRDGRSADAISLLREHDAAHMLPTQREAMMRMVQDWNTWRHDYDVSDTLMVVHTTNADVDTVNMLAQAKRIEANELGHASVKAPDRDYQLHVGDRVMFRTEPYIIDERGTPRVENGTRGTIIDANQRAGTVRVALEEPNREPRIVTVELDKCEALRLDYASHVYPAQGDTRSRTAELTGGSHTSKEAAYVGGSRLRDRHDLYTSRQALGIEGADHDRWQRLADQMDTSRREQPSVNYREQPERQIATELPEPVRGLARETLTEVERELAAATAARDELRRTYPGELEREIDKVTREWRQTRDWHRDAERSTAQAERDADQVKPWQRDKLREARHHLEREQQRRDHLAQRGNRLSEQYQHLTSRPNQPAEWKREHAAELAAREQRLGELTPQRDGLREQAIEQAIKQPPRYLTRVLGDTPPEPNDRQVWQDAAREIERYRLTHNVTDERTALGREPEGDWKRHQAFDKAKDKALDARERLGLSERAHRLEPQQPAPGLTRPGPERGLGRGFGISR